MILENWAFFLFSGVFVHTCPSLLLNNLLCVASFKQKSHLFEYEHGLHMTFQLKHQLKDIEMKEVKLPAESA